ncbi:MAG: chorismate-binding protein [Jatrophihabitans sp.]
MSGLRLRAVRIDLGPGPDEFGLVRRAHAEPGLICLSGDWAGGTPLLTSRPLRVARDLAAVDEQPTPLGEPTGTPSPGPDFVGGGWFGVLPYAGSPRLALHDHVVRYIDRRWIFEALWSGERADALDEAVTRWRRLLSADEPSLAWSVGRVSGPPRARHLSAVERGIELIRAGELYQVNVCTRLRADFAGSPAALFADTVRALRPARGALVDGVVSLSPELFVELRARHVRTAPIKGTLPRTGDASTDGNAARLRTSAKDTAENVMIVDLMRNDLGRVCVIGSVRVPRLLDVQAHPGVWHLVSEVTGRLRADIGPGGLLRATFPPGSVTGAPKVRAVAAIGELESDERDVYTGAIGFVSPWWGTEFSVAIRTFETAGDELALGVGGGVTADSVPMLEWRECLHKAAPLLAAVGRAGPVEPEPGPPGGEDAALLETVLVVDGVAIRLADHLARLDRSLRELRGVGVPPDVADRARAAAATTTGRAVLRVVSHRTHTDIAVGALPDLSSTGAAVTAVRPAGSWRHKWADRSAHVRVEQAVGSAVPLFLAGDGTVLETSRGNVFLLDSDGGLVTAPLRDDLLPGVTRRALLDLARDEGRPTRLQEFGLPEMGEHPAFWTSSLRGAVPIHRVDGVELPRSDAVVAALAEHLCGGRSHDS